MSEHNKETSPERRVKPAIRYVTWSAIASIIPLVLVGYQLQKEYTEWHYNFLDNWLATQTKVYTREQSDHRFAPRDDMITLAEATDLRKVISQTAGRAESNSKKLDAIQITGAVQLVIAAEQRVDRLQENPRSTPEYREQVQDAKADLAKAKEYRDCLRANRGDCDGLRVW